MRLRSTVGMARRGALFGLLFAAALGLSGCNKPEAGGGAGKTINFSILSTENSQNLEELWKPFLADMNKQTGLTIKPFFASDYQSLIQAMKFNQVQLGWFSNFSGLKAVEVGQGEVFAHSTDPSGVDGYFSVIVVNPKSGITLDRILKCDKSVTFGMGDPNSTSGTLAPMTYLFAPKNIDPQTCFKVLRSANHEANLMSVAHGQIDAATNNTTNLKVMARENPAVMKDIQVVWTSPRLPEDPIVWRKDLDPATKEKIRSFFLTYGTAPGAEGDRQRAILKALSFGVFKPATNAHLLPVREMQATEQLIEAKNAKDQAKINAAQAELAKIAGEKTAAGAEAPAAAPAR